MAERDDIEAVGRRYRALPREEPSSALDAAILTQARRAAADHPAPLVAPAGRRGWAYPLAAAAIIVLAVGVTVQIQRGEPDAELAVMPSETKPNAAARNDERAAEEPKRADAPAKRKVEPQAPSFAAPPTSGQAAGSGNAEQSAKQAEQAPPAAAARDELRSLARSAPASIETPEKWLERIAKLRDEGRDDEADRQLAEFRRRYPDFRIAEETLRRVERRAR